MLRSFFYISFFIFYSGFIYAQPKNNTCSSAITLRNLSNWCSSPSQFTNQNATPSGQNRAKCFFGDSNDKDNDVWFKFVAKGNTLNVSVIGAIKKSPKGTLEFPQVAIYRGLCPRFLEEIGCFSDAEGYHIAEVYAGLTIGETYYIRVDGKYNRTGTFQLCVNNYNSVPSPSGDCTSGVVLCDMESFTVPKMVGIGKYRDPIGITCLEDGESSSAWYKWTAQESGTLTMDLIPVNPSDDIDFAIFWLPGGLEDCSFKIILRCMASGESPDRSFAEWKRCTGATGLRAGSSDFQEEAGCQDWTDDNYLAPLQMEKGKSYALLVNNYHNTGNGFSMKFGGTAKFEGPKAHFKVSKLSIPVETELKVWNVSSFEGKIVNYEWDFGVDASPRTHKGWKAPNVTYKTPGQKSISLTVETDRGCVVTKVRNIKVVPKPKDPPKPKPKTEVVQSAPPPAPKDPPASSASSIKTTQPAKPAPQLHASTDGVILESPKPARKSKPEPPKRAPKPPKKDTVVYYDVLHVYKLYYESDSSTLKPDHLPFLNEAVTWLQKSPKILLQVEGHTNNIPQNKYCNDLAEKRAGNVINYLSNKGAPADRLTERIHGKEKPQANNKSLWGRKRNQRVEIKVLKPEE